ncbi:hypothetical protein [Actinacidiphila sp. bgisy145]|uniref:hypothetical protein n=1 Tax=Actinacidiphila sp. bgisy145 TaxID=3413792 RepID=UPI003EB95049
MTTPADVTPADSPDDPNHTPYERVQMVNPSLPDIAPVSVTWMAFTIIWQPRGWVLYTPPDDGSGTDSTDPTTPDAPADPQEQ